MSDDADAPGDDHDDDALDTGSGRSDGSDGLDVAESDRPKKRWFDRGLVWLAVVVVLAGVAVAVSFLAEEEDDTAEGAPLPSDIQAFCSGARALAEAPQPTISVGDASAFVAYKQFIEGLRLAAPSAVAARLQRIEESFDPVILVIEAPETDDMMTEISDALDAQSAATAPDAEFLSAYIERACGFNLAAAAAEAQSATTSTDGTASEAPDGQPVPGGEVPPDGGDATSTTEGTG